MIKLNGHTVDFGKFPNGESFADIDKKYINVDQENKIFLKFENDEDIFHLVMLKDFVDENSLCNPCKLIMPYVPYSRMDRQEEKRLFTLKTFSRFINNMNFSEVEIMEPHSEVTPALIDRVRVVDKSKELALIAMRDVLDLTKGSCWFTPSYEYTDGSSEFDMCLEGLLYRAKIHDIYLVYPDGGADKRYSKQIKYKNVIKCSKKRDFNTGNITQLIVNNPEESQSCKVAIIVDDLSSKGGTFSWCASELRKSLPNLEQVILCVAHCENTIFDGNVLSGTDIDKVYTTNSIIRVPNIGEATNFDRSKLEVIDIC